MEENKTFIGWEDGLAVFILLMGTVLQLIPGVTNSWYNVGIELIGISITVLIIENVNQARSINEEKKRLILQMGSPNSSFAREAVRQLREREWLEDGSASWANLSGADLSGASLRYAELSGALLLDANLRGTDLWGADLSEADLRVADLSGANLVDANLSRADLRGTNLNGAKYSKGGTKWPDDFDPKAAGA